MSQQFRAVLFDVGGVIVDYKDREKYLKLYKMGKIENFIKNCLNLVEETPHLFELLESFERGLIKPTDIKPEFLSLLGVNPNVQLKDSAVVKNMGEKNPIVERAIDLIHKSGNYKLAILTNNGFWKEEQTTSFIEPDHRFHYVIESCRIGHRKPDASFYEVLIYQLKIIY